MSKGLEALKEIKYMLDAPYTSGIIKQGFDIIEKELKEYEEMKRIKGTITLDSALEEILIKVCPNVAKKLKALEIMKSLVELTKEQKHCWLWLGLNGRQITQEQYDLLKEVLNDI